jgi:hypothetical protein
MELSAVEVAYGGQASASLHTAGMTLKGHSRE